MVTTTPEERIAQLLRLAEDQAGTPEGELAAAQAERLMIKHAIDRASLDMDQKNRAEEITTFQFHIGGAYNVARAEIVFATSRAMGLRAYYMQPGQVTDYVSGKTTGVGRIVTIVGFESDVDECRTLIQSLDTQAAVAMKAWYQTSLVRKSSLSSPAKENHRRAFIESFGRGAAKRIKEMREVIINEASSGTQLAVIDRSKAIDDHMSAMPLRMATRKSLSNAAGYAAGQNANVGGRGIGAGQRGIGR